MDVKKINSRYCLVTLAQVDSTNSYARNLRDNECADHAATVINTENQTGGRGQRGNSWESEPGKNLTFSLMVHPRWMSAARQFELSMLVSLGIINALRNHVEDAAKLRIKWPNDIYYGDRKLCGILIENSIAHNCIERAIIGVGVNVNQKVFTSDAPNPVSLAQITGTEYELASLLDSIVSQILDMMESYENDAEPDELSYLYNNLLWRRDGKEHVWRDVATGKEFSGKLNGVELDGRLDITDSEGCKHSYLFKQVEAVL